MNNLKLEMMQRSLKVRLEAEYPVKGSELLSRDSFGYELEVHNAILLYGALIDKMIENKWILQWK